MIDRFAKWLAGIVRNWRIKNRRESVLRLAERLHAMGYAMPNMKALERSIYGNNEAFICQPLRPDGAHAAESHTPAPAPNGSPE